MATRHAEDPLVMTGESAGTAPTGAGLTRRGSGSALWTTVRCERPTEVTRAVLAFWGLCCE